MRKCSSVSEMLVSTVKRCLVSVPAVGVELSASPPRCWLLQGHPLHLLLGGRHGSCDAGSWPRVPLHPGLLPHREHVNTSWNSSLFKNIQTEYSLSYHMIITFLPSPPVQGRCPGSLQSLWFAFGWYHRHWHAEIQAQVRKIQIMTGFYSCHLVAGCFIFIVYSSLFPVPLSPPWCLGQMPCSLSQLSLWPQWWCSTSSTSLDMSSWRMQKGI